MLPDVAQLFNVIRVIISPSGQKAELQQAPIEIRRGKNITAPCSLYNHFSAGEGTHNAVSEQIVELC